MTELEILIKNCCMRALLEDEKMTPEKADCQLRWAWVDIKDIIDKYEKER